MNNIEKVKDIMEHSKHGAMAQLVVLTAIEKYVELVSKMSFEEFKEPFGNASSFINSRTWYDACKEIKAKLDDHLGN